MGILNMLFSIVKVFVQLLYIPLIIAGSFLVVFILAIFLQRFLLARKGVKVPKLQRRRSYRRPFLLRLLWDAPRRIVLDQSERPADFFPHQGCIIFTGRQGRGKTVSLVHSALLMKKSYRSAKLIDNLNIKGHNDDLKHWKQLITYKNGFKGVICCIDEMQNWFSSAQSKDFPPEMLSVITQNRKNRRIILGTSQSFHLLAKAIRSQATEVRECHTFLGCITFVIRREPFLDSEGNVIKMKWRGMYMFVHDKELREAYDTWHVVESLSASGFVPEAQRPGSFQPVFNIHDSRKKQ